MLDETIHSLLRSLISDEIIWLKTSVPWIRYYYAEDGIYLLRDMRYSSPSFALVAARNPDDADLRVAPRRIRITIEIDGGKEEEARDGRA